MKWSLVKVAHSAFIAEAGSVNLDLKGTECYDRSYDFVQKNPVWSLVHGVIHQWAMREDGKRILIPMGHAWAEIKDGSRKIVYDAKRNFFSFTDLYYKDFQVTYVSHYTAEEARLNAQTYLRTDAWDERVAEAAHTGDSVDMGAGEILQLLPTLPIIEVPELSSIKR